MNITLQQQDVEKAIALYLDSMGITATVQEVAFKAGRKGAGLSTTVTLTDTRHAPVVPQPNTVIDQITPEACEASQEHVEESSESGESRSSESLFG